MIKNRKTVVVAQASATDSNTFKQTINIPFQPHEVILKSISVAQYSLLDSDISTDLIYTIECSDLVVGGDNPIMYHWAPFFTQNDTTNDIIWRNSFHSDPDIYMKCRADINGDVVFSINTFGSTKKPTGSWGVSKLALTLEFIEYARPPRQ